MTVKSLITELETYDPELPIVLSKNNDYRSLSFSDILLRDNIKVNGYKEGNAIIILGYDD